MGSATRVQRLPNQFQHTLHFVKHLIVPKAQHNEAPRLQERGTRSVCINAFRVLASVQFNDNLSIQANEIDDVVTEWMLPTEPAAI